MFLPPSLPDVGQTLEEGTGDLGHDYIALWNARNKFHFEQVQTPPTMILRKELMEHHSILILQLLSLRMGSIPHKELMEHTIQFNGAASMGSLFLPLISIFSLTIFASFHLSDAE